jgi:hypothetical protein
MMELLLFVLIVLVQATSGASSVSPRSTKQSLLSSSCRLLLPVAASALHVAKAAAAEYKGKLEYQPALQGLDYGSGAI